MINSIIIVRMSAIGDVIMLLPMVRRIQKAYPKADITWIISKPAYFLVEGIRGIEFIVMDKPKNLLDYWRFYRSMRRRKFDVLLATQASLRANLLYPAIRAQRKIGYDKVRARDLQSLFTKETISPGQDHTLEGFLRFATSLGIPSSEIEWNIPLQNADHAWASSAIPAGSGPLVIVNPAASKLERCWFPERYISVIKSLQAHWQARVVLVGGPGPLDAVLGQTIEQGVTVTNLIGKTHPKQLLALLQHADVVCCPDTGTAHMASAMRVPVVALHAVTNPAISAPYLSRDFAVSAYPANLPWGTQVRDREMMKLITVDAVVEQINCVLSRLSYVAL